MVGDEVGPEELGLAVGSSVGASEGSSVGPAVVGYYIYIYIYIYISSGLWTSNSEADSQQHKIVFWTQRELLPNWLGSRK